MNAHTLCHCADGATPCKGEIRHRARSRRGSVYVLVLAAAAMLTVIGIAAATLTRTQIRTDGLDRDVQRASGFALSATHAGIAWINTTPDWRTRLRDAVANGVTPDSGAFKLTDEPGGALCKWWIDDGFGGAPAADPATQVRVIGLGRSGRAQRVLTVMVEPDSDAAIAALRSAAHSGTDLTVKDAQALDGPLSSNGKLTVTGTVDANVEAGSFDRSGTLKGTAIVPTIAKPLPPSKGLGVPFNTLLPLSVPISFSSLPSGKVKDLLLAPAVNPFGSAQVDGIYSIDVPGNATLEICDSRISGTLLVTLRSGAKLHVKNAVLWAPAREDLPALVVLGNDGKVEIENSSIKTLSESTVNFNPASTPYAGLSDNDKSDSYPSQISGLIHVAGGTPVKANPDVIIFGCVLADGPIEIDGSFLRADPALASSPMRGYPGAVSRVRVVQGSWRQPPFSEVASAEPN